MPGSLHDGATSAGARLAEGNPAGALASQLKSGSLASLLEVRVQVPGAASMGQRGAALTRQDAHRSSQG